LPGLAALLGVNDVEYRPSLNDPPGLEAKYVLGWGNKPNTLPAQAYARTHGLGYLRLEDGFLRSVGLGREGYPPYALVVDDLGIYYDATRPSRLEALLNGPAAEAAQAEKRHPQSPDPLTDPNLLRQAQRAIDLIVKHRLSKYNRGIPVALPATQRKRILVVDQTSGDCSISCGLANDDTFKEMLTTARRQHPDAEILIKSHPDVLFARRQGHFGNADCDSRTRLIRDNANPIELLQQVDHVYVVTSLLGFEALLIGKSVTCFGAPFYAGWGLTDDRVATPIRQRRRSLTELFAAAYLLYSRYIDPDTRAPCDVFRVIDHLVLQRQQFHRNAGTWLCVNMPYWKRPFLRRYIDSPWNAVYFVRSGSANPQSHMPEPVKQLYWGKAAQGTSKPSAGCTTWCVEDGFLRSLGLGSDFTVPLSLCFDSRGIYFDPNAESDLERILARSEFDPALLARAALLRRRIVDKQVSKYNPAGLSSRLHVSALDGQTRILVVGQVESDASIRFGCPDIRTNAALLARVRNQCPDAYVVYKPHPDVVSGNRPSGEHMIDTRDFDLLVTDVDLPTCLDAVDEVHTMTSLVGFEALLRGKRVVTYGIPFYAGWGLTHDRHAIERRSRRLTLDELVAGTLILYPRYVNPATGEFTTPESVLDHLAATKSSGDSSRRTILTPLRHRLTASTIGIIGEYWLRLRSLLTQ
jgi:capsular polysaccharide export protein